MRVIFTAGTILAASQPAGGGAAWSERGRERERRMVDGQALRVAQIGCGQISTAHFKSYAESPAVRLVAVVDTDRDAAAAAAAAADVPWTERFEDVLEREDVQLVSV